MARSPRPRAALLFALTLGAAGCPEERLEPVDPATGGLGAGGAPDAGGMSRGGAPGCVRGVEVLCNGLDDDCDASTSTDPTTTATATTRATATSTS